MKRLSCVELRQGPDENRSARRETSEVAASSIRECSILVHSTKVPVGIDNAAVSYAHTEYFKSSNGGNTVLRPTHKRDS